MKGFVNICRSPDRQKLDESGISSEEGCIPQQVYSQLTDIVSLVRDLETALDLSHTGTDSCSKTLSDSGGGKDIEGHTACFIFEYSFFQEILPAKKRRMRGCLNGMIDRWCTHVPPPSYSQPAAHPTSRWWF